MEIERKGALSSHPVSSISPSLNQISSRLTPMTQDRIAESGMDRLGDMDFNGWFKAAQCLDINHLANEAFHLASRCPPTHSAPMPTTYGAPPHMPFSLLHSHPPATAIPAAMHTHLCALPPGIPMDIDHTRTFKPLCKGNLTNLGRILHLSLAKGNPKRTL
jgi:hypothetical protein